MQDVLSAGVSELYAPIRHMIYRGGKRLRPLATVLSHGLFKEDIQPALRPSLATEFMHSFSLIHDDVMDNAPLRRGAPSVYAKWGLNTAILSGDLALVWSYKLLSMLPVHLLPKALHIFNVAAVRVCEGQYLDLAFEKKEHIDEAAYLEMVRLKTGFLLGGCFSLGALIGDASEKQILSLQALGEKIGIILQVSDDFLDVYSHHEVSGKRVGTDIINNKKTLLLIKALEKANVEERKTLAHWLRLKDFDEEEKIAAIVSLYDKLRIKDDIAVVLDSLYIECTQQIDAIDAPALRKEALLLLLQDLKSRKG